MISVVASFNSAAAAINAPVAAPRSAAARSSPIQMAFVDSLYAAALQPAASRPRALRCRACADEDGLRASDLSRELKKYQTRRLRVAQSGPVRRGVGAVRDAIDGLGAVGSFYRAALEEVSVHRLLLVLTLLAFGVQQKLGAAAMMAGARINAAISQGGQWHRLVTPIFLHGGGMHLLSNCFSLYRIGPLVEGAYGGARCLLLYVISGVGGNLAGLVFGSARGMSVGASGAVLGLMGAAAAFVVRNKRALGSGGDMLLNQVGQLLLLNLFIGLQPRSGVDNLGHVGGAATGAILGLLLAPSVKPAAEGDGSVVPMPVTSLLLVVTLGLVAFGLRDAARLARVIRPLLR